MERDIDQIINAVKRQIPNAEVAQWKKRHPADDDGVWWFHLPGIEEDIQIESAYGNCLFIVETNESCCDKARRAETIADAVAMIVAYLNSIKEAQCSE